MGVIWKHGAVEACWKCLKSRQPPFPADAGETASDRAGVAAEHAAGHSESSRLLTKPPAPEMGIDMETNSRDSCSGWELRLEKFK